MDKDLYLEIDDNIIVNDSDGMCVIRADNDSALSTLIFSGVKTASTTYQIKISMPIGNHYNYDVDNLMEDFLPNMSAEDALNFLSKELDMAGFPQPSLDVIRKISSRLSGGYEPDIIKIAQWGGGGGMPDSAKGRGTNTYSPKKGKGRQLFYGIRPGQTYDAMLDFARGDTDAWNYSTETKLMNDHNGHRNDEDEQDEYNMTWDERIKKRRLEKLKTEFKNRDLREKREHERSPEFINTEEPLDPVHYTPLEMRLIPKREVEEDVGFKRKLEEPYPEWHERRRVAPKLDIRRSAQTVGTSPTSTIYDGPRSTGRIRPPGIRMYDHDDEMGREKSQYPSDHLPGNRINDRQFPATGLMSMLGYEGEDPYVSILNHSPGGDISELFQESELDPADTSDPHNRWTVQYTDKTWIGTGDSEFPEGQVPYKVMEDIRLDDFLNDEDPQEKELKDIFDVNKTVEDNLESQHHYDKGGNNPWVSPSKGENNGVRDVVDRNPNSGSSFKR